MAAIVAPIDRMNTVKPSGYHLNFSPKISGERIALKIIEVHDVEPIKRRLPQVIVTR